jgi:hypothetical protein
MNDPLGNPSGNPVDKKVFVPGAGTNWPFSNNKINVDANYITDDVASGSVAGGGDLTENNNIEKNEVTINKNVTVGSTDYGAVTGGISSGTGKVSENTVILKGGTVGAVISRPCKRAYLPGMAG